MNQNEQVESKTKQDIQAKQSNKNPNNVETTNIKERLLDIESLLLLLDSDPCLQEYHFRVIRMIHNILKELIV